MRYKHSLSIWSVTPIVNWMIVFGGKTNSETTISDTAVIELSEHICAHIEYEFALQSCIYLSCPFSEKHNETKTTHKAE